MRHAAQHSSSVDRADLRTPVVVVQPGRHDSGRHARSTTRPDANVVDAPTTVLPTVPTPETTQRDVPLRATLESTWARMGGQARASTVAAVGLGLVGLMTAIAPIHYTASGASTTSSSPNTTTPTRFERCTQSASQALDTTASAMAESTSTEWVGEVAVGQELLTEEYGADSAEVHAYRAGAYDLLQWMYTPNPTVAGFDAMVKDEAVPDVQAMCSQYS